MYYFNPRSNDSIITELSPKQKFIFFENLFLENFLENLEIIFLFSVLNLYVLHHLFCRMNFYITIFLYLKFSTFFKNNSKLIKFL